MAGIDIRVSTRHTCLMGMQRMFNVTCDGPACYEIYDEASWYSDAAKALAIRAGWKIQSSLAICPDCQDKGVTFSEIKAGK